MKGSDKEGKGNGRREGVKKSNGEEKGWWREVVTKGSDDEGDWWWRDVAPTGSGEWWRRDVVMKENGEKTRCGRLEVVRKGSSEEGKRTKRWCNGGKNWWCVMVRKGSCELGRKPEFESLFFSCEVAMKGTSFGGGCGWVVSVANCSSYVLGTNGVVLFCFLKMWLVDQIGMEARLFVICSCEARW